jgi:hypothetical protein
MTTKSVLEIARQLTEQPVDQDSFAPTTAHSTASLVIGHDGKPLNQPFDPRRDGENLHIMYLREKPLLDKIKQMRIENERLQRKM